MTEVKAGGISNTCQEGQLLFLLLSKKKKKSPYSKYKNLHWMTTAGVFTWSETKTKSEKSPM